MKSWIYENINCYGKVLTLKDFIHYRHMCTFVILQFSDQWDKSFKINFLSLKITNIYKNIYILVTWKKYFATFNANNTWTISINQCLFIPLTLLFSLSHCMGKFSLITIFVFSYNHLWHHLGKWNFFGLLFALTSHCLSCQNIFFFEMFGLWPLLNPPKPWVSLLWVMLHEI